MIQVNMHEAKTNLSKLVHLLETGDEDSILIARDGKIIAKMVPFEPQKKSFVGIGKILSPEIQIDWNAFDAADSEIETLFGV